MLLHVVAFFSWLLLHVPAFFSRTKKSILSIIRARAHAQNKVTKNIENHIPLFIKARLAWPVDAQTVKNLPMRHPARLAWPVDAQAVKHLPVRHPARLAWPVGAQAMNTIPRR